MDDPVLVEVPPLELNILMRSQIRKIRYFRSGSVGFFFQSSSILGSSVTRIFLPTPAFYYLLTPTT